MLNCRLEEPSQSEGSTARLHLEGTATLETAGELKQSLIGALERFGKVVVDCREVVEMDLSSLQLLCAAHRTAISLDKRLTLAGCRDDVVGKAIEEAGFQRHRACLLSPQEKVCLWVQQPECE